MVEAVLVSRYVHTEADGYGNSKIWRQLRSGRKKWGVHHVLVCSFLQPIGLVEYKCTSFLQSILETVYGLSVNIVLWQFIPSIDDPLGKEVQTWIAVTMLLRQFPSVPSDGSRGGVQGVQTPVLLFRCPFLKRTYFENLSYSLRFLADAKTARYINVLSIYWRNSQQY